MKRYRNRLAAVSSVVLLSITPALPVSAQSIEASCAPLTSKDEDFQITVARTWLPFRIGIDVMKASCRVNDFFVNIFKRQPDPDKATLEDVVEASKPDETSTDSSFGAKMSKMPSPTKSPGWNPNPSTSIVVLPPNTAGGVPLLFQPNSPGGPTPTSVNQIEGNGTLISSEGMKRGTFKQGKLNGIGEEIDPNGTWRGGTFQNGTNMGYVYEVRTVNGKTYIAAGSVVNGKLDGMIERVYADGSTQFEDWENGQLMQVGNRALKGRTALAPQTRYKPPVEVATEDSYKKIGPRPKIAPGTTFDPVRAIGGGPYRNQILDPVLPASFYARYTGHNLPPSECNRQSEVLGWTGQMNAMNTSGDLMLQLRGITAGMEALIVISRQCENVPGAQAELDNFARQRSAALANCAARASNSAICRKSPFQ